jgi:hypothetical protein
MDQSDGELIEEQLKLVSRLSETEINEIDQALLSYASSKWQKVAKIVGLTMMKLPNRIQGIPDVYYAERVKLLVEKGALEAEGNLNYMRYSEVRLSKNET